MAHVGFDRFSEIPGDICGSEAGPSGELVVAYRLEKCGDRWAEDARV